MENDVLKAIKERRSIRRFKADQITDEELKTVLEAGTWAATGHGTQKPFIVAVQNTETCAQLRKMNAEVMGVESDPLLWRTYHCHRSGTLRRGEQRERRKPHPWQHDACRPLHRACFLLDKP